MDCAGVAGHLVGYHFAIVSDDERDAIDAHLLACKPCLETYFALKRAATKSPLEKPSAAMKQRLRAEVAAAFPLRRRPARVRLLARRIPLYQGLFAAAFAAAFALIVPTLVREADRERHHDIREGAANVDTARPRAESFQIY